MSDQTPPEEPGQEPSQQPLEEPTAELPREPAAEPELGAEPAPVVASPRWQDRVLGVRGVAAVAAGALLVGGLGGFALGHVVDQDRGDWRQGGSGWHRGPGGQGGGPDGWGPQRGPGQQQPPPWRRDRDSRR